MFDMVLNMHIDGLPGNIIAFEKSVKINIRWKIIIVFDIEKVSIFLYRG